MINYFQIKINVIVLIAFFIYYEQSIRPSNHVNLFQCFCSGWLMESVVSNYFRQQCNAR